MEGGGVEVRHERGGGGGGGDGGGWPRTEEFVVDVGGAVEGSVTPLSPDEVVGDDAEVKEDVVE